MSESERESWLCSLNGEEEGLNKFIAHSGYLVTLVPNAQERLRDIQAEKQFVQTAPEEVIGELMPKIFPFQKDAEKRLQNVTITFPQDSHFYTEAIVTTSGSLLPMQEITETVLSQAPDTRWANDLRYTFVTITEEKSRKDILPLKLDRINVKLGEAFLVAKENVEKARSGPEFQLISFAAIGIRDVVNKIWQGLCYQARQSCPDKLKGYPQLEIKSEPARQVVAECFGTDDITIQKCKYFLDKLFDIHNKCSASDFGKDILNKDLERLNSIYTTWITAIDELIKLLRI